MEGTMAELGLLYNRDYMDYKWGDVVLFEGRFI